MSRTIFKEIEYKGFNVIIYKDDYNPNVVCTKEIDRDVFLKYFFTNIKSTFIKTSNEIVVEQQKLFKEQIDNFYIEIESVSKDNLYELLSKYTIVYEPDYDEYYSFVDENIFNIIMKQYNKNYGIE